MTRMLQGRTERYRKMAEEARALAEAAADPLAAQAYRTLSRKWDRLACGGKVTPPVEAPPWSGQASGGPAMAGACAHVAGVDPALLLTRRTKAGAGGTPVERVRYVGNRLAARKFRVIGEPPRQPAEPAAGGALLDQTALTRPPALNGGGDMGARMRAYDWLSSPLGPPERWPQSLRTATTMMLNTLQPMFIAWGPELTFLYNDSYAPMLGARHPALGRSFRDVWADIWDALDPLMDIALSGRSVWQEDLRLTMHRHGYPEETYFTFTYSPLHDETGEVAGMFCTCVETTQQVMAQRRLRETAEALAVSRESYRRQGERLFSLFEEAPGFVAVTEGPDHVFTLTNAAYRQLVGHRDVIGLRVRDALPEVAGAGFFELLDRVYATGEPYTGAGLQVTLQGSPDASPEPRFVDFVYQPIRDEAGAVTGIFVQGSDVTERERFVEQQQLLLNELNHRVKNNMATVQSLAAQTARRAPDVATFVRDFEGRLVALARTHDVLTQNAWVGADLKTLMARELAAFPERIRLDGPAVQLDAGQALALGLIAHELATNAAKYGALTAGAGRVEVTWTAEDGRLALTWVEHGGPPVTAPSQTGFGSRLISKLAAGDLGGSTQVAYPPEGFRLTLAVPLHRP